MKYQVKSGCTIYHKDVQYNAGDVVELDEAKALHHAPNITVFKPPEKPEKEEGEESDEPS
jgi:hypothetical protein